jgi:hypothetical protein
MVEALFAEMYDRRYSVSAIVPDRSTSSEIRSLGTRLVCWVVGGQVVSASVAFAIAKFVH